MPDLLFHMRHLMKEIPVLKGILFKNLSDSGYVQIMMSTLINCVAVSVSIFAYYVARTTGRTQIEQHWQEILISATSMRKNIKKNCSEIFYIKRGTGNNRKIVWDENLEKYSVCLFAARKITLEQRDFWQTYVDKIISIKKCYEQGEERIQKEKVNEFCHKFLKEDTDSMEFGILMSEFLDTLNNIIEGE